MEACTTPATRGGTCDTCLLPLTDLRPITRSQERSLEGLSLEQHRQANDSGWKNEVPEEAMAAAPSEVK